MKQLFIKTLLLITSIIISNNHLYAQAAGYKIVDKIIIGGSQKWDYLTVHKSSNRLFVSHDTDVVVINLADKKTVGHIGGLLGVHGVAFGGKSGKGYITEGKGNQITVFDLNDLHVIKKITRTGDDPDAISFDSFSERIFSSNGKSKSATAIDIKTDEVAGTVNLSDSPEASVSDSNGKVFFNIESQNEVNVVDSKTLDVINKWNTFPCEQPVAISFDKENNRLFVGGRNQICVIIDAASGKVIANFPIGKGVDASAFDSDAHLIFFSNKDGSITVIKQSSANSYELAGSITTLPGAKTMALDKSTHQIYSSAIILDNKNEKNFGVLIIDNK